MSRGAVEQLPKMISSYGLACSGGPGEGVAVVSWACAASLAGCCDGLDSSSGMTPVVKVRTGATGCESGWLRCFSTSAITISRSSRIWFLKRLALSMTSCLLSPWRLSSLHSENLPLRTVTSRFRFLSTSKSSTKSINSFVARSSSFSATRFLIFDALSLRIVSNIVLSQ